MPIEQLKDRGNILFICQPELNISADWFDSHYWQTQNAVKGNASGRGTVWFIDSPKGQWVLRRYRRGGLMAKLTQFRFLFLGSQNTRPFQELTLLNTMHAAGLPVPTPIAGQYKKIGLHYQASILTQLIHHADELFCYLLDTKLASKIDWPLIGQTIKRFHLAGIDHTDLNCHNIMLDTNGKVWLIDFDKCRQRKANTTWQEGNLQRLKRSLDKEASKHPHFLFQTKHWQALLEGYYG